MLAQSVWVQAVCLLGSQQGDYKWCLEVCSLARFPGSRKPELVWK